MPTEFPLERETHAGMRENPTLRVRITLLGGVGRWKMQDLKGFLRWHCLCYLNFNALKSYA